MYNNNNNSYISLTWAYNNGIKYLLQDTILLNLAYTHSPGRSRYFVLRPSVKHSGSYLYLLADCRVEFFRIMNLKKYNNKCSICIFNSVINGLIVGFVYWHFSNAGFISLEIGRFTSNKLCEQLVNVF